MVDRRSQRRDGSGALLDGSAQSPAYGSTREHSSESLVVVPGDPFDALEQRFRDREDGVSTSHRDLRRGIPGLVRTDITAEQLSGLLNDQLMQYSPADVKTLINSFPEQSRECAQFVLAKASGFASLESLRDLAEAVRDEKLLLASPGALAENLSYICNRKTLFGALSVDTTDSMLNATALVLDSAVLDKLESDPQFAKRVADQGLKLFNPRGYISGISAFNTVTPAEIQERVGDILLSSLTYQSKSTKPLEFATAVNLALDTKMIERLLKAGELAGVGDKLLGQVVHVEAQDPSRQAKGSENQKVTLKGSNGQSVSIEYSEDELRRLLSQGTPVTPETAQAPQPGPLSGAEVPDAQSISRQLNGLTGMTPAQVKRELDRIPEGYRASATELVARTSVVCSPRTLAYELRAMHASIEGTARKLGVSANNVYYLVPELKKSYGMVAMAYMQANNIPSDRFIDNASKAKTDSLIVVLDDVSGSGSSLRAALYSAKAHSSQHALAAPIIATSASLTKYESLPHQVIGTLKDSDLIKGLEAPQAEIIQRMVGGSGFDGNALCVAFTYMSPDNNSGFWSTHFAPYFTISPQAIKGDSYSPPNEETARQIAGPALKKKLAEAAQVLAKNDVDFAQEIALARTVDALTSVASQFRIALTAEQTPIASKLHARLTAQCETVAQRADEAMLARIEKPDFKTTAAVLVDLDQAHTYLRHQRTRGETTELARSIEKRSTNMSVRASEAIDTEISVISQGLQSASIDLSTLNQLMVETGDLKKVARIVSREGDALSKVQRIQKDLFDRTRTAFEGRQTELSQALANPIDLSSLVKDIASVDEHLRVTKSALPDIVDTTERQTWGIEGALSKIERRSGGLVKVAKIWNELVALDEKSDLVVTLSAVGGLIRDFKSAGKQAEVSADGFTDRAVASAERSVSQVADWATRTLKEETLAAAIEVRTLAAKNVVELIALERAAERNLESLASVIDKMYDDGTSAVQVGVASAIRKLSRSKGQIEGYGFAPIRSEVRALAEVAADTSVPANVRDRIPRALGSFGTKVNAAVDERLVKVFRNEEPASSLKAVRTLLDQVQTDSKSQVSFSASLSLIGDLERYAQERQLAMSAKSTETRIARTESLLKRQLLVLESHPVLEAEVPRERERLLAETYKILKPYLDFAHGISPHAPSDQLKVMKVLPGLADLFPREERAEILSALSQRQRNAQLARDFFENKVPDFFGAIFSPEEITAHALELAAVLELVSDLDESTQVEFVAEMVVAATLFAKAVQRSLDRDPQAIGTEQRAAIRLLYRHELGQGFLEEMSICGFNRSGYYGGIANTKRDVWSHSDQDILGRLESVTDFSRAMAKTSEERRASIAAVLGQVAKFVGTGTSASSASAAVLDTLGSDAQGDSALAKYLASYS